MRTKKGTLKFHERHGKNGREFLKKILIPETRRSVGYAFYFYWTYYAVHDYPNTIIVDDSL
jgi:hypothetical protein